MNTKRAESQSSAPLEHRSTLTGSNRRTLDAIFRHPLAHNLEWSDVIALIGKIGEVEHKPNNEFVFTVQGEHHSMRQPHNKDIGGPELILVRHFLSKLGWSNESSPKTGTPSGSVAPNILVVVDHHEAKIFAIDVSSNDVSTHSIKPYDPYHFQHHLAHKGQSREPGQRTPEDIHFYEQIAHALVSAAKIVVVGHGTGKSNAADHLMAYLAQHDHDIHARIMPQLSADLSSITEPQMLEMARAALA